MNSEMAEYAVLIPIVRTEYGKALLMEVRSDKVRQPREICFPGGRIEPGETPEEAAVREIREELGIQLCSLENLRYLRTELMSNGRVVHSLTAEIKSLSLDALCISEDEVAEAFLLPIDWIKENKPVHFDLEITPDDQLPAKLRNYLKNYGEFRRRGETDYWEFEGHGIWGLTARIIRRHFIDGSYTGC